jgi:hypothetical protein
MKNDDKIRSRFGVTVCLRDMGNGKSRLFFDDVIADKDENPITWDYEYFCTFSPELEDNNLDTMQLTDSQFQQIGEVVVARLLALNKRVKISMAEEFPSEDLSLTSEEESEEAKLSEAQIENIDETLLSKVFQEWRKVAMVVSQAMSSMPEWADGLPDVYYVQRLQKLVKKGVLECQGDLACMRTSEVRLHAGRSGGSP